MRAVLARVLSCKQWGTSKVFSKELTRSEMALELNLSIFSADPGRKESGIQRLAQLEASTNVSDRSRWAQTSALRWQSERCFAYFDGSEVGLEEHRQVGRES